MQQGILIKNFSWQICEDSWQLAVFPLLWAGEALCGPQEAIGGQVLFVLELLISCLMAHPPPWLGRAPISF